MTRNITVATGLALFIGFLFDTTGWIKGAMGFEMRLALYDTLSFISPLVPAVPVLLALALAALPAALILHLEGVWHRLPASSVWIHALGIACFLYIFMHTGWTITLERLFVIPGDQERAGLIISVDEFVLGWSKAGIVLALAGVLANLKPSQPEPTAGKELS